MSDIIRRLDSIAVEFGGEEHSGWLPPGAATPLPTPIRRVILTLAIVRESPNDYLLCFEAQDGSMRGDNWYDSLAKALEGAEELFGVSPSQWQDAA